MIPDVKRLNAHYITLQAGFWAMFAAICGFQAALLLHRGFTSGQVGVIGALRCLAGMLCQPLLGGWADRHPQVPLKHIVDLSLLLSLVTSLLLTACPGMGFAATAAVFLILGGFEISSYPLMDAMAMQFITAGAPIRYSLGRGIGSLSYAVTCVLLGLGVERFGVEFVLRSHAVLMVLEMLLVRSFPTFPPELARRDRGGEQPHSTPEILRRNPRFALALAAIALALTAVLPLSNFLISILQAKGGGERQLGVALFLMAAFELPGSLLFAALRGRGHSSARLLLLSLVFMLVKEVLLLLAPTVGIILLFQPVQMLGYGVFTPASVYYVSDSVPPEDQVKGQTLMMVASNGLGGVLGSLLAGRMLDLGQAVGAGASWMLAACALCGAAAAVVGFPALWKKT